MTEDVREKSLQYAIEISRMGGMGMQSPGAAEAAARVLVIAAAVEQYLDYAQQAPVRSEVQE